MISFLSGRIVAKKPQFIILEANGIGFRVFISPKAFYKLPKIGSKTKIFCHTHNKQDGMELYGFLKYEELEMFELLISISGIGPKNALKMLGISDIDRFFAIINKNRTDLLTKAGIGKKTAERIVLELKDKIKRKTNEELLPLIEADSDIEKALKNLGYKPNEIQEAIKHIPTKTKKIEDRIKEALKILAKN
ncbi:Holliday junction DNA helicase RuvA [Candidatus Wolfebacteria bacterium RIFCSPLOWO2_01_FULL_38_11]|uniref:Holliday junction branch migration complex subunit RuvA n=2 Tax=Candidatus Wolfeibacteriota TaxID=1752735 RepID=A0A0G0J5B7_9BACT|nr:MAG: Holliday junction ATP-dependent DNA helicase RuvA [Candidatus Wolfebacteria bacterium GW2011_GWC1_37_10]OGM90377.1 MAG: Holliday junction DNA helicase RuvA [Candidatus Wolfebacteria bacterium RIFCSPLOWO2_01_FULL_38_11]